MKINIEKGAKVTFTDKPIVNVFVDGDYKRLTPSEVKRVSDLQKVWEYLYSHKVYELCDTISLEIGYIKGTIKEDEEL